MTIRTAYSYHALRAPRSALRAPRSALSLVECIKRVRSEGLTIDKYAQAGVNQNSGNVYIWSEDWMGCVYCTISMVTCWSYSCLKCGEEYNFDTEQECREYAELHDGACEQCQEI